jgi:hypothetical protein
MDEVPDFLQGVHNLLPPVSIATDPPTPHGAVGKQAEEHGTTTYDGTCDYTGHLGRRESVAKEVTGGSLVRAYVVQAVVLKGILAGEGSCQGRRHHTFKQVALQVKHPVGWGVGGDGAGDEGWGGGVGGGG